MALILLSFALPLPCIMCIRGQNMSMNTLRERGKENKKRAKNITRFRV
jgi:hypothetical protein